MIKPALVACLLLACLLFAAGHFLLSEAASEDGFEKITVGMKEADVQAILGAPDPAHVHRGSKGVRYFYGGFPEFKWCSMEVFFDADGRVTGKFHDH